MSPTPRVSVLLPVRDDAADTLRLTWASLRRALSPEDEVVLVRHGSSPAASKRIAVMAAADSRVRVVPVDRDAPFAEALNGGVAACTAPLIARMDSDDLMHPQRLHHDVAYLRTHPACDVVCCRVRIFPRPHPGAGMARYIAWQNGVLDADEMVTAAWIEQPVCHPSATFRADVLRCVPYRDGCFPEDYDLFMRLLDAHRIEKRPAVHHGWRLHAGQTTWSDDVRFHRDAFAHVKVAALLRRYSITSHPVFVVGAGKEGGRIGRALAAAGAAPVVYFDIAARRVGRVRHGAPIVHTARLEEMRAVHPGAFAIGAVGTSGARPVVRAQLRAAGFVEGRNAVIVA